jgi:translocation and assembly module TamB
MNADFDGTIDFSGEADLNVRTSSQKIPELDLLFHHLQSYFKGNPIAAQEFWAVKGAADFQGKLDKTVWSPFDPRITGQVQARNVFYHGVPVDTVQGNILFYDRLIQVFDSNMTLGRATGQAQAKFFLEDKKRGTPDAMDLKGAVQNFPAHTIAGAFGLELPVSGNVDASIDLKGPFEELVGRSDFEATNGEAWGEHIDRATGTVLFLADSLGLRDITAYMDGGYAKASGDLAYDTDEYTVQLKAENVPVEKLNVLKTNDLNMSGTGSAEGSGSGTFKNPQLRGVIHLNNLSYENQLYGDVSATVKLEPDLLTVAATGQAHGAISSVRATAHLNGEVPFESSFDIEKFPLEIFTSAYAPETQQLTGLIGGKFEMDGTLNPGNVKHLAGALNLLQLNLGPLRLQQTAPVDVRLSDNVVEILNCNVADEGIQVSLTGKIYPREQNRLALELSATAGLDVLSKWDPSISASGPATTKVAISGTLKQPSLSGALEIRDGSFRHSSLPNSLTEIQALVTFKNRSVTLQSFNALSSGGKLTAGGSGVLKGYSFDTYRFDVYAEQVRVQYPEGLRTTVNGELHLQKQALESYLTGNLNVIQGIYSREFEETPSVFRYARVPGFAGSSGAFDQVKLNVHIESNGNLLVRNSFADMTCSANLNLIGTINDPVLTGRVEVVKGSIVFREREYQILRGSLDFSNPYRTDPQLNFVAETRIREYHISLTFNGTFDRIYHDVTSDPPLPRDDLYALLGGFSTTTTSTTTPTQGAGVSNLLLDEGISRFIAGPLALPIERGFRKAFGLQRFHIDPTYVQSTQVATARITLEKDISTDFSVTISTNLFTVAEEIILLQYQLTDEIRITASKDELARYGVDVLVTKTFE